MLKDQHVLSWIGASHSSCASNWMLDPSWAAAPGCAMPDARPGPWDCFGTELVDGFSVTRGDLREGSCLHCLC